MYSKGNKELDYEIACAKSNRKIYYTNDTLKGFSGAPVLAVSENGSRYKVIGIHNGGVEKMEHPRANYAHNISHLTGH